MEEVQLYQWILVVLSSLILIWISPKARSANDFFFGSRKNQEPNFYLLTSSLVISWLFAKSITNAANLGLEFGFVGGVAYASYFLSFITAGIIIYQIRSKGGYHSIHEFLRSKYGQGAIILFSILIAFRLFNEIWSNTMVIGTYFGDQGSSGYYLSILVFTLLTLWYSLKGGMSSSILTDLVQMIFFSILLLVILSIIIPKSHGGVDSLVSSGQWKWSTGVNLILVGLIQCLSYPFHDPVLTDRGFISDTKTTFRAFLWAGLIGVVCILLFSFVGVYGQQSGIRGQAPVEVARLMGTPMILLVNFIMITSAASTLDSSFSSFAKLSVIDLKILKSPSISNGRLMMATLTILGTLPILLNPAILSATTISGTMVIGLAPIFIFWNINAPKISYYLSIVSGLIWGFILLLDMFPHQCFFTDGKYADLLTVNILGTLTCFSGFLLPYLLKQSKTGKV